MPVVSPDEMNQFLQTVIVAPMTTVLRSYPTRIHIRFQSRSREVALDQVRAVDRQRLVRRLGKVNGTVARQCSDTLVEMFRRE